MILPKLRIARPTDDVTFYIDGLGLQILFEFEDHDGFDGIIIGFHARPII